MILANARLQKTASQLETAVAVEQARRRLPPSDATQVL